MRIFNMYQYLNPSVLKNIDAVINAEVIPFVKSFQSLSIEIQNKARTVAMKESPCCFVNNLKHSWQIHNKTALDIDGFLTSLYKGDIRLDNIEILNIASKLLSKAFDSERKKRIYSAGLKISIDYHLPKLISRYNLSREDVNTLLSIWKVNFWTYRYGEHCLYRLRQIKKKLQTKDVQQSIISIFHAGENTLFKSRFGKICGNAFNNSVLLKREVANYKRHILRTKNFEIHGIYLTQNRPALKSIQELILYDNREEYVFGYNLYGIPDLFLRKELVNFLVKRKYLPLFSSVLKYTKKEILLSLQQIIKEYKNGTKDILTNTPDHLWCGMLDDDSASFSR